VSNEDPMVTVPAPAKNGLPQWLWPLLAGLCFGMLAGFMLGAVLTRSWARNQVLGEAVSSFGSALAGAAGATSGDYEQSVAQKAYRAAMRSDLRNLVTAEESFFADSIRYSSNLQQLAEAMRRLSPAYQTDIPSAGVTIQFTATSATGWSAIARHRSSSTHCSVFVGSATSPIPGGNEGEPVCR
jgi:hypothetical protein